MQLAKLISFDDTTYTAAVELRGSRTVRLRRVAVNRAIPAAEMIAGRPVAVILFDGGLAVILAVW